MRLDQYFAVSESSDVATFQQRLIDAAAELDFGLVSAALVLESPNLADKARFVSVTNAPEAYESAYSDVASSVRDPVLMRLKRLSVPFIYDQDTYTSEGAADLWEQQAPFGYRTGISVALHLPEHRHFLLGVDREARLPVHQGRLTRMMADLQLLAVHAQEAAARLLRPDVPIRDAPKLTAREIEILRWTMAGKSAWAVGELLSISEHTVNFHFRGIFKKLDSASKHQAVLKAMALGLLS